MSEETKETGFLDYSLDRNSKQIRKDRGDAIKEDLEIAYQREVQDLERNIKRAERNRVNMFDFSPSNTLSLVLANDINVDDILAKDQKARLEIRNMKVKLNMAKESYNFLFGQTYELEKIV